MIPLWYYARHSYSTSTSYLSSLQATQLQFWNAANRQLIAAKQDVILTLTRALDASLKRQRLSAISACVCPCS